MQIHELTQKKKVDLEEGVTDTLGGAVGKTVSGVKNVGSAIASPFKNIAGGYRDARMDQKISAMADKSYRSWKSYETQLLKSDPNARTNGQLEQSLLAWVSKNLLGGMYLPNVVNKDKIIGLVKQISGGGTGASAGQQPPATQQTPATQHTGGKVAGQLSQTPGAVAKRNARAQGTQANAAGAGAFGQMANQLGGTKPNTMANAPVSKTNVAKPGNLNQPQQTPLQQATALQQQAQGQKPAATFGKVPSTTTPVKVGGATRAGAPTPEEQAVLQQKIAAATKKPAMNEAIPTVKPTVRPVGGLAARSAQRNAPVAKPGTPAPAAPGTPAPASAPTTPAAPGTPATPATPTAPASPGNEKELFKQLVQQASLAQTAAPGGGASGSGGGAGQPNAKAGKGQAGAPQDARGMAQALRQQLDPAIVKALPALAAAAEKLSGTKQVSSTGNPAADGLLILMGFQGL
jgi:hypothetical protein